MGIEMIKKFYSLQKKIEPACMRMHAWVYMHVCVCVCVCTHAHSNSVAQSPMKFQLAVVAFINTPSVTRFLFLMIRSCIL
jgi:hypothetical protein